MHQLYFGQHKKETQVVFRMKLNLNSNLFFSPFNLVIGSRMDVRMGAMQPRLKG